MIDKHRLGGRPKYGKRPKNFRRDEEIRNLYAGGYGLGLSELARRYKLSHQRIEQIVKYNGYAQNRAVAW